MKIGFNKPYHTGQELKYISEVMNGEHLSGNGPFTKKCQTYFEERYGFKKCLLTTSCTDALEMAAILAEISPGDEVIMPSFTFVSTSNAFVLRGAKIIFCDSRSDHPGMDEDLLEGLITSRTKAIVPVHYAGVACDMDKVMALAERHNLIVIEDAAQAIDSFYTGADGIKRALGSIGHLAAFSFHETKNIISGEGGMLVINDGAYSQRAKVIWEKGTNRAAFFRGEIDKYGWVDVGSSFLPSELIAAFLWAQLEKLDAIQQRRLEIWNVYQEALSKWSGDEILLPNLPPFATNNAHMYYLVMPSLAQRTALISYLRESDITAVFHYQSLHKSPFYSVLHGSGSLPECERYSHCLARLPFYYQIEQDVVLHALQGFERGS